MSVSDAPPPPEASDEVSPLVRWMIRHAGVLFFVSLAWMPLVNRSRFGDLSSWYTDHLHHTFATWVFFSRGVALYTRPFEEISGGTSWPYPNETWPHMPGFAYPPGVVLVFLPITLVGRTGLLSPHAFGVASVLFILAWAAWAFQRAVQVLELLPRGSRAATLGVTWMMLAHMGLQGFFDAVFLGAGLAALAAWRRDKPDVALGWLVGAAFVHYRAAVFAPLGAWALVRCWKERAGIRLFVPKLAVGAGLLAISLVSFVLMYPVARVGLIPHTTSVFDVPNAVAVVLACSVGLAALLAYHREWMALATLGIVVALVLVEPQAYWWHGVICLAVPYCIGALRRTQREAETSLMRSASLLWFCVLLPLVWRGSIEQLFLDFVRSFKWA